jgi:uncharacterized protein DUF3179
MRTRSCLIAIPLALMAIFSHSVSGQEKNGFDLGNSLVPADEILAGGPPRDGIPSIDNPAFEPADSSLPWQKGDLLMTLDQGQKHYAYPVGILNWHEIVNHKSLETPVLITFCPLCGTGLAFDPVVGGRHLTFGVSGLLYNSDLLMYDHQTESLWSQIEGRAISGPLAGTELAPVPVRHELWQTWRNRGGGDGLVLSTDTGYRRNYRQSPYGDYDHSERLYFPVSRTSREYHPKTWVLGWTHNGESKAWPFPELADQLADHKDQVLRDEIGGKKVSIHYDPEAPSAELRDESGQLLPGTRAFWFAWYTFHPETLIFRAE